MQLPDPTYSETAQSGQQALAPTDIRLRILEQGYSPLANKAKVCLIEGWPTLQVTPKLITGKWRRIRDYQDTGIRCDNGLMVIDLDINHALADTVSDRLEREFPVLADAMLRWGSGEKRAWFLRCDEVFKRISTRRWLAPGTVADDGAHCVEVFASPTRQFGSFGANKRDEETGEALIMYEWASEPGSPLDVPLADLPVMSKADVLRLVDIAEEEIAAAGGWEPILRSKKGESHSDTVYDLTDEMVFECNDGVDRTLLELQDEAARDRDLRCSASWIEGPSAKRRNRCLVGLTKTGLVTVWESSTEENHMSATLEPRQQTEVGLNAAAVAEGMAKLLKLQKEADQRRSMIIDPTDDYDTALGKALNGYAFCPEPNLVVPVWADQVGAGMSKDAFRTKLDPNSKYVTEKEGNKPKKHNPYDAWHGSKQRIEVAGLRMRPDMPRPLYEEDYARWVNIYSPTAHPATGGDAEMGQRLLEQVLPDPVERLWFTRWMAFKYRNPAVPGPAVLLVARDFGTGRGTVATLIKLLFGSRYVKPLDFKTFTGKTYQAQYNTWMAENLIAVVNESAEADGGSVYATKRDTYERLKELIEPRAERRHFARHGQPPFTAYSFCSFFIATNHIDALPLPDGDRRIWVGTCGEPREQAFWDEVNAWMGVPENVGAFARWLEALDLGAYSPYAPPPMTPGKRLMTEMSKSPIDVLLAAAIDALPGAVLLPEQIIGAMKALQPELGVDLPDHFKWEAVARKQIQSKLHRIGVKDGPGWTVRIENQKHPTYARSASEAKKWADGNYDVRHEALKNGTPASPNSISAALKGISLVSGGGLTGG